MLLGTLLSTLETPAYAVSWLENTGDLVLLARIEAAGAAHDEPPGEYAANAVARFSQAAGDEEWLALMTKLERSEEPAGACLAHMVRWALANDEAAPPEKEETCTCGGQGGCHGHG